MREMAHGWREVMRRFPEVGLVVLAARDGALRDRLARRADRRGGRLRVGGLVPDLDRYLVACDLLVSKGGGLITSEAMAVGVPVLVHRPIPGQEEANARRLSEAGAAHIVEDLEELLRRLDELFGDGSKLADMKDAARRTGRPDAAREIAAAEALLLEPA
jgi:processive 1,2-diacylglycerol beta-glucosyltransferase